jgi:hypothetical protein
MRVRRGNLRAESAQFWKHHHTFTVRSEDKGKRINHIGAGGGFACTVVRHVESRVRSGRELAGKALRAEVEDVIWERIAWMLAILDGRHGRHRNRRVIKARREHVTISGHPKKVIWLAKKKEGRKIVGFSR